MNHDDNQRPATHLNCGYAFLVSLLTPNDYLCFNFIICRIVAEKVGNWLNTWQIITLPQPRKNSDRCMARGLGSSITDTFPFGWMIRKFPSTDVSFMYPRMQEHHSGPGYRLRSVTFGVGLTSRNCDVNKQPRFLPNDVKEMWRNIAWELNCFNCHVCV